MQHFPNGKKFPALEANILKYRTIDSVLIIFHVEHLKRYVKGVISASSRLTPELVKKKASNQSIWDYLVQEKIIFEDDYKLVRQVIEYRNILSHEISRIAVDLTRERIARDLIEFGRFKPYDYEMLAKTKTITKIIRERLSSFVKPISFEGYLFEAAEKVYEAELKRLDKKIRNLLSIRKKQSDAVNEEIQKYLALNPTVELSNYKLKTENGKLSSAGLTLANELFSQGYSALAVAYLLRISLVSVNNRMKKWKKSKI